MSALRLMGGRLRNAPSSGSIRARLMRCSMMKSLSGGSATVRVFRSSTTAPPAPNVITGPNTGSRPIPTTSSRSRGAWYMRSTVTPTTLASGRSRFARVTSSLNVRRTEWASSTSSRTPSTSDLWRISGELIFMATGNPSASAVTRASLAVCACIASTTGIRKADNTALASTVVSALRLSAKAPSMIIRVPSISGVDVSASGAATCNSRCWLRS